MMPLIRIAFFSIAIIFLSKPALSQNDQVAKYRCYGELTHSETNEPIPYAHVVLQGTTYGTITNRDGRFSLPIDSGIEVILEVTSVGYQKRIFNFGRLIEDKHISVKLSPLEKLLHEVVVKPKNYELKLLKAAINNIPKNYPNEPEVLRFFTRNITSKNGVPYYVIELTGLAEKQSYERSVTSGNVQMLESQKVEFRTIDSLDIRFYAGGHIAHWTDLVAMRASVLNLERLSEYELELTDTIASEDALVYIIDFWQKDKSKRFGSGQVFIESQTYAIVKMNLKYEGGDFGMLGSLKSALNGFNRTFRDLEVSYVKTDGYWRISNASYATAFEKNGELEVELKDELMVLGVDTLKELDYLDRLEYLDILLDEVNEYDSNYWKDQNVLLASDEVRKALSESEIRNSQEPTRLEKISNFLSRCEFYFGLGVTDYQLSATRVVYSIQEHRVLADQHRIFQGSSYYSYALTDQWAVSLTELHAWGEKHKYKAYLPGIKCTYNLNPKGRPVKLKPMISAGYMDMEFGLGLIEKENYVGEALRKFDAESTNLFLRQMSLIVSAQLGISIEINPRLSFALQGGVNQLFFPQYRLKLEEDQFFLKARTINLKEGEDGLIIDRSSELILNTNWNLSGGLVWGF